jgi:hypothetical protein
MNPFVAHVFFGTLTLQDIHADGALLSRWECLFSYSGEAGTWQIHARLTDQLGINI